MQKPPTFFNSLFLASFPENGITDYDIGIH